MMQAHHCRCRHKRFMVIFRLLSPAAPCALQAASRIMAVVIAAAAQATPLCCRPLNEFHPQSWLARETRQQKRRRQQEQQLPEAPGCPQT
jgi:hypothetical protein